MAHGAPHHVRPCGLKRLQIGWSRRQKKPLKACHQSQKLRNPAHILVCMQ